MKNRKIHVLMLLKKMCDGLQMGVHIFDKSNRNTEIPFNHSQMQNSKAGFNT